MDVAAMKGSLQVFELDKSSGKYIGADEKYTLNPGSAPGW